MKYVIGYSGGKDCTFTVEKLKEQGHELVGIIVLKSKDDLSFNHALPIELCRQYASALGVPLYLIDTKTIFEPETIFKSMLEMKNNGVEAIAYGATHIYYDEMLKMANKIGLKLFAPLFHIEKETLMDELLSREYKMFIVNASKEIPFAKDIIGKYIDRDLVKKFKEAGVDISGNDGCYHSQVVDCPLYKHPIKLGKSRIVELDNLYLVVFDED